MFKTLKVKRSDKLTTLTLNDEIYTLLSLKLGQSPDSQESLPAVRAWVQATVKQFDDPKQRNFSQWITGQAVYFLADASTQAAYQGWLSDMMISDRLEDRMISDSPKDRMISDSPKDRIISEALIRINELKEKGAGNQAIADTLNAEGITAGTIATWKGKSVSNYWYRHKGQLDGGK